MRYKVNNRFTKKMEWLLKWLFEMNSHKQEIFFVFHFVKDNLDLNTILKYSLNTNVSLLFVDRERITIKNILIVAYAVTARSS